MRVLIGPYQDFVDEAGCLKERKIDIHIDDYDIWSMDYTLALIILPMLKQLKNTKHGSPGDIPFFSQVSDGTAQYCFDFYADGDMDAWKAGHEKWNSILDKMIWSFEQILDTEAEFKFFEDRKKPDLEGRLDYYDKVQEGLTLFGQYYRALWD